MKPLTGRKVFVIAASAFAVIIAANVTLATQAIRTFPGLEAANATIASRGFDVNRQAQQALRWTMRADYADGELALRFTDAAGVPVAVHDLDLLVGRTTDAGADVRPVTAIRGEAHVAPVALAPGRWMLRVSARAGDGTPFRQRLVITVGGDAS
ncbi:FixH family protein [Paracoccus sp. PAMC 22219]|uniref:FixH family protein n=1 Tax=Paracoccus sp. PAMC 22219 TaxID=1569209 RepID=UPI0005AA5787|nr:FixH family protein [Paracoccus sp. PAMC 22219]